MKSLIQERILLKAAQKPCQKKNDFKLLLHAFDYKFFWG